MTLNSPNSSQPLAKTKSSPSIGFLTAARWHWERALWTVSRGLSRGRWMAFTAALLMAASLGFVGAQILPMQARIASLQSQIEGAETGGDAGVVAITGSAKNAPEPLNAFQNSMRGGSVSAMPGGLLDSLPAMPERTAILQSLVDAAPKHNLSISQGQYVWRDESNDQNVAALQADKTAALQSSSPSTSTSISLSPSSSSSPHIASPSLEALQWVVPVKGSYRDIREYVGELLGQNPSLALDAITLGKNGPAGARLDADLRFILYLRGGQ